jgi:Protein of unknown function (DUF4238)
MYSPRVGLERFGAMSARQHHYVSQCYLKGFCADRDKPRLFVIDLKEKSIFPPTNPKNVAVERDFHSVDVEGLAPDAFETYLAEFETQLDNALRRIVAARSIRNENDRAILFKYIALLAAKNPQLRESFRVAHQHMIKIVMDLATATPEKWASQIARAKRDGFLPADAPDDYEKMREFLRALERDEYRIDTLPPMHVSMEVQAANKVLPLIFARKWMLFKAPANATGLITSDHPVGLMWTNPAERGRMPPPGLRHTHTQLLFPISNELAAISGFEIEEMEADADETLVAQINGSIILHAGRQIYARAGDFAYLLKHSKRIMRGTELLDDLATARDHYSAAEL